MRSASGKSGRMKDLFRQRSFIIVFCMMLMAAAVYIIGESLWSDLGEHTGAGRVVERGHPSVLAHEVSGFYRADRALGYLSAPWTTGRTLAGFYGRRAYPGGPPYIPHPVESDRDFGGRRCLQCHEDGGYAPRFDAYTPVTPHPDLHNCRQCHVPLKVPGQFFRKTTFVPAHRPVLTGGRLPGGPPPIPHTLEMRENCLACHAGAGAVVDIRTTHPDRINCRQCHASPTTTTEWIRAGSAIPGTP